LPTLVSWSLSRSTGSTYVANTVTRFIGGLIFALSKSHKRIIHLFASLAFASPSGIGFDPTVWRVKVKDKIQYEYTVADKTYVTIKPICDYRADSVEGRATCVWEVCLKDGSQETFALKDVWMFSDDQTEGDI
jgi:hypothetical protein